MARMISFREGESDRQLSSRQIFVMALENAPQGQTIGFADFERRFRALTALRAADGDASVVLEDADWETLKGAVGAMRSWVQVPTDLMGWLIKVKADLFEAPKVEIAVASGKPPAGKPVAGEPA